MKCRWIWEHEPYEVEWKGREIFGVWYLHWRIFLPYRVIKHWTFIEVSLPPYGVIKQIEGSLSNYGVNKCWTFIKGSLPSYGVIKCSNFIEGSLSPYMVIKWWTLIEGSLLPYKIFKCWTFIEGSFLPYGVVLVKKSIMRGNPYMRRVIWGFLGFWVW